MNGISNICLPDPRFGFDESTETLTRIWQGEAEYLKPNIRIFDVDYPIRHLSSWWPIRFLIFSHTLTFSCSDWSVQTKSTTGITIYLMTNSTKNRFFSIDDFTPKFIEISGNPSFLYVIDCTRTYYDTQINEIIKITYKINPFTFWTGPDQGTLRRL